MTPALFTKTSNGAPKSSRYAFAKSLVDPTSARSSARNTNRVADDPDVSPGVSNRAIASRAVVRLDTRGRWCGNHRSRVTRAPSRNLSPRWRP